MIRPNSLIQPRARPARAWRLLLPLTVVAASIPLYWSTLHGYFLADDFGLVQLYARTSLATFPSLFAADWSQGIWGPDLGELRPIVGLTYWLEYRLWGADAAGYHAGNLLYHGLALWGLYVLVLESGRLLVRDPVDSNPPEEVADHRRSSAAVDVPGELRLHLLATLATALFLVHPAHVEAVTWIAGRTDLLGAAALFWAMYGLARAWRTGSAGAAAAGFAAFAAGLFTKENMVTLPALFAVYVLLDGRLATRWRRALLLGAPLVAGVIGWFLLRRITFGQTTRVEDTAAALDAFVGRLTFYAHVALPQYAATATTILVLLFVLVAVYGALTWNSRGRMLLFWGVAWTGIHFVPLVAVTYQSPRHIFLASAGLLVAFATAATVPFRLRPRLAGIAFLLCVLLLFRFTQHTVRALPAWETSSRYSRQLIALLREGGYPEQALIEVGSNPPVTIWFWQWALPFAEEPPFLDLELRVVGPPEWDCCASFTAERERRLAEIAQGRARQVYRIEFNHETDRFEDVTLRP